jgi:hypothetical protein
MGCSSQKNAEVDDSKIKVDNHEKKNSLKKGKKDGGGKSNDEENKNDNDKDKDKDKDDVNDEDEEAVELDDVERIKKEKMMHDYYFYPTKEISKNRFITKSIKGVLPSDFASKEKTKKGQFLSFLEKNKKKKNEFTGKEEESSKEPLFNDEFYLFNRKINDMKAIRTLKRDEIIKPYNYVNEYEITEEGVKDKKSNKDLNKYEYYDMFPNGEAYKFYTDEEIPKDDKNKINLPKKKIDEKKIEEIKKNDVNDIANIINKELKENGLINDNQKLVNNDNDF